MIGLADFMEVDLCLVYYFAVDLVHFIVDYLLYYSGSVCSVE